LIIKNIIYIILLLSILLSQNTDFEINEIRVSGNVEILEDDIIDFSGLSEYSSINAIDIQNAIKRLWLLNKFKKIDINLEEDTSSLEYSNNLIITVEEYPILNKVDFSGDYFKFKFLKFKKSKSELTELSELNSGTVLSQYKIINAVNLIKEDFIKRNYHDIDITYTVEDSNVGSTKNIIFNINPKSKTKIKNIQIIDNGKVLKLDNTFNNIIENLNSKNNTYVTKNTILRILKKTDKITKWKWYLPWRGTYNNEKLDNMSQNLKNYYRLKGYLDFVVSDYEVIKKNNIPTLVLNINSGSKYHINNIDFGGNYIFSDSIIDSILLFKDNDIFNGETFQFSQNNLMNLYRDKGYLFAEINPSIIPVSKDSLNINFDIKENSIIKVNKIIIKGNQTTHDNVIRRDIDISPGEIYNHSSLMESLRKLYMLNYFESVFPDIKPTQNKDEVDIIIEVSEKSSGQLNFSAGYSGLVGFTGGGGFSFPNFLGKGQRVSFNYQRGLSSNNQQMSMPINNTGEAKSNQTFSMQFVEPRLFDTSNLVGVSMSYSEQGKTSAYKPFDSKTIGGGMRLGRRFKWPDNFFQGSWSLNGYKREYFSDNKEDLLSYYPSDEDYIEYDNGLYVLPSSGRSIRQSISRDNRDHPEFPTKGSQFNWDFTFSGSFLGGNEDYYKNELGFKWYNKIVDKLVIHQNFKIGLLTPLNITGRSIVPYSARFLMGGSGIPYGEMLRGYSDNMIGPIGSAYPRGGNVMLKYSLELRYLISENPSMYMLIFADAGNVWDNINIIDPFSLRRSMGIGVRVMMPMLGILGYDIGYGFDSSVEEYLSGNNSAHGWEYHFIFGLPIY